MAFTDEQFDARLSPMFRSMRPATTPKSPLNGLLSAKQEPVGDVPQGSVGGSVPQYQMPDAVTSPSRAQVMSQPARTQYAASTPPSQSPQQVWRSPSASNMRYPDSIQKQFSVEMPLVPQSVTAGLLDSPAATVASGINSAPMQMPEAAGELVAPPPPYTEVLVPQNTTLAVRPPEYLAPAQYVPLQPSRRYEVI